MVQSGTWQNALQVCLGIGYLFFSGWIVYASREIRRRGYAKTVGTAWPYLFGAFIALRGIFNIAEMASDVSDTTLTILKVISIFLGLFAVGSFPVYIHGFLHRIDQFRNESLQHEIALRKQAERANAEMAELLHLKDNFLSIVSHEVKTPVSSMVLWAQLIQQEEISPVMVRQGLRAIEQCSNSLTELVDELLESSRITLGKFQINPRRSQIKPLLDDVLSTFRPMVESRGLTFEQHIEEVGVATVDPQRFRQVVLNLLANSAKFTSAGWIGVDLDKIMVAGQQFVRLAVRDTGRGFTPESLDRVFDRFARIRDMQKHGGSGGLGLGLSITKHIVEMHGGMIYAKSEGLDKGSTFIVHFPVTL